MVFRPHKSSITQSMKITNVAPLNIKLSCSINQKGHTQETESNDSFPAPAIAMSSYIIF